MKCICDMCNGTGYVKEASNCMDYPYVKKCPKCKGSGCKVEQEQTNEEWFDGLSTEEKAEFLAKKCCEISCKFFLGEAEEIFSRYWVEWLKQPYKPFS